MGVRRNLLIINRKKSLIGQSFCLLIQQRNRFGCPKWKLSWGSKVSDIATYTRACVDRSVNNFGRLDVCHIWIVVYTTIFSIFWNNFHFLDLFRMILNRVVSHYVRARRLLFACAGCHNVRVRVSGTARVRVRPFAGLRRSFKPCRSACSALGFNTLRRVEAGVECRDF